MRLETDVMTRTKKLISIAINQHEADIGPDAAIGITDKWDSFGQLNLILLVESEFNLMIPDDLVASLTSLKAIVSWLMLQP